MTGAELQWQFMRALWLGGALLVAMFAGLLLGVAGHGYVLVYLFLPVAWLVLLPYHAKLALIVAVVTFNSAFIVPFVPGRPFVWEATGLLAWSGLIVTFALREQLPGLAERIKRNWMIFAGALAYDAVLLIIMRMRGVGFLTAGNSQVGGRVYVQQIIMSVFPLLFAVLDPSPRILVRLFLVQCWFSLSFLVADLALAYGGKWTQSLLFFLELPTDGINFEHQAQFSGIRRFQSFFYIAFGLICFLCARFPLREYLRGRGIQLWILTLALLFGGLFSGHRMLLYSVFSVIVVLAYAQRMFTPARVLLASVVCAVAYVVIFFTVSDLPVGAQRPLSILPGITVDSAASADAQATMDGRRAIKRAGWEAARNYRWLGRGFGKNALGPGLYTDLTYMYVDNGIFYNGLVGLMVNTGLPGTIAIALFFLGGSVASWRVIVMVRRASEIDALCRLASLNASLWTSYMFSFIFLHGDSEFTMRQFAIPAAMVLACEHHLRKRENAARVIEAERGEITPPEVPPISEPPGGRRPVRPLLVVGGAG